MIETGKTAKVIAEESGMLIVNDTKKAEEVISKILSENAEAVSQYQSGEKKVFGFLMGQCTKSPSRRLPLPVQSRNYWKPNWQKQNRQSLRKNLLTRQMRRRS